MPQHSECRSIRKLNAIQSSQPSAPTISTGACPPTVAGPYAAWMPRKSLHGRTCGVSCDGGRARALQSSRRSSALADHLALKCDSELPHTVQALRSNQRTA
ncbi:hypothetical protein BI317_19560 [Xanthomonas hortorum pv. gardneri]|nr:hypothetical protein BJD10_20850 [Xanthomonas hortorum pv. gardneri]APP86032.1 hypothetical protein BI317_19560 [Xanthomonas hortorum pv. gardneri]